MCEGDSALAALRAAGISMCSSCGFLELRVWGQGHRRRDHEVKLEFVILCWYDCIYYVISDISLLTNKEEKQKR